MDIWLDTTNVCTIQKAVKLGLLAGVTTNPHLIAQAKGNLEDILENLLHHQEGPVAAQVMANEVEEIVQQGQNLHALSNRVIVKVPLTEQGLEAIHLLSRQGIPTIATAIFHSHQALLAALAGADYVAPYISRLENAGEDPWAMLTNVIHIFRTYRLKTKVLGASLKSKEQIMQCANLGIEGITIKEDLFEQLITSDSLTLKEVENFAHHWQNLNTTFFVS